MSNLKTTDYIWAIACELSDRFGWKSIKIDDVIRSYFKNQHVSLRGAVSLDRVREELDEMDWDFIFSEKLVYWVVYYYMWEIEVGS